MAHEQQQKILLVRQVAWVILVIATAIGIIVPAVATNPEGEFKIGDGLNPAADSNEVDYNVIVWEGEDDDGTGIVGKRLDLQGEPLGIEFRVNTTTVGTQQNPDVAILASGDFVVVWQSGQPQQSEVLGQRFSSTGEPLGIEFRVNTIGRALYPAVGADTTGNFVVVWAGYRQGHGAASRFRHFVRRYASDGQPYGSEQGFDRDGQVTPPALAVKSTGEFLVAWEDAGRDIRGLAFSSSGVELGNEFRVNANRNGQHTLPAAGVAADGDYAVAWNQERLHSERILLRRVSALGEPLGIEHKINVQPVGRGAQPRVAGDEDSSIVVVWPGEDESEESGTSNAVFARLAQLSGEPLGIEFRLNSSVGTTSSADVTLETADSFFVVWQNEFEEAVEDPDILGNCVDVVELMPE